MALPSSGQISMGDINVELGRTRTTANTSLAGGSTPAAGSLFALANVNKVAPHAISEFYGYSNVNYNVTVYGRASTATINIQYSINGGTRTTLASSINTTCSLRGTITAGNGSTITLYMGDLPFKYTAGSSTCPAFTSIGSVTSLSFTLTGNITYALNGNPA